MSYCQTCGSDPCKCSNEADDVKEIIVIEQEEEKENTGGWSDTNPNY